MQQTAEKVIMSKNRNLFKKLGWFLPLTVFILSISIALVAIFAMNDWVELSEAHHAVQHVLIFMAGAGSSASLIALTRAGGRHEG